MRTDFELLVTPKRESLSGDHVEVVLQDEAGRTRAQGPALLGRALFVPGGTSRNGGTMLWEALAPYVAPVLEPLLRLDVEVRVLLRVAAPPGRARQILALPWEALGYRGIRPVLQGRWELVRLDPVARPLRGRDGERIRVLFLIGAQGQHATQPSVLDDLWSCLVALRGLAQGHGLDFELAGPSAAVGRGRCRLAIPQANRFATERGLLEILRTRSFHAIHFIGHSDAVIRAAGVLPATGITFDVPGQDTPLVVPATTIRQALAKDSGATTLFVLNACLGTEELAPVLLQSVDHVLAMNAAVPPPFCGRFMTAFYGALSGDGCQHRIGPAVRLARRAVRSDPAAWMATHHAATPHDVLFDPMGIAIERYCQHVQDEHRRHRSLYGAHQQLDLDDVHVYLSVSADDARGEHEQVREQDIPFGALLGRPHRRWLLRGEPGAGKTTTLRHHALDLAGNPRRRYVPLYLPLPQWLSGRREATWAELLAFVAGPKPVAKFQEAIDDCARRGETVLLLDGYDELDTPQRHALARLLTWLERDPAWSDAKVVLALRTSTVVEGLDDQQWQLANLQPLDPVRQERLLRHRFRLARPRRTADALAHRWAQRLNHELPESTRELSANPLFLSFFAELILLGRHVLKRRRHDLLGEIVTMLLDGAFAEATRRVRRVKDRRGVRRLLAEVAWKMSLRCTRTVRTRTIESWTGLDEQALRRLADHAGILVPAGRTRSAPWQFTHRQLQEALCAEHWWTVVWEDGRRGSPRAIRRTLERLVQRNGEPAVLDHWTEPVALLAGRLAGGDMLMVPFLTEVDTVDLGIGVFEGLESVRPETVSAALAVLSAWRVQGKTSPRARVYELIPGRTRRSDAAEMSASLFRLAVGAMAAPRPGSKRVTELGAAVESLERVASQWPEAATTHLHAVLDRLPTLDHENFDASFAWCRAPKAGRAPFCFEMGSHDEDRFDDATRHQVEFRQESWIGATPVTLGQYRLMVPDHEHSWGDDLAVPVTEVSWFMAWLFARWLEHQRQRGRIRPAAPRGLHFALPTEAQWEYAARAGTIGRFWNGDEDPVEDVSWCGKACPRPVARGSANPWGLHDVHGNVWEWCQDWYGPYGSAKAHDPHGPEGGRARVKRGGSYGVVPEACRAAFRFSSIPDWALRDSGFRLVLSAKSPSP